MKIASPFFAFVVLLFALTGCDSQSTGLTQQRVEELEAKLAASQAHLIDMQQQLVDAAAAKTPAAAAAPMTAANDASRAESERGENIANAAKQLGTSLQAKLGPSKLSTLGEIAWVGMTLEGSGVVTGVAVPFYKTSNGIWLNVWSEAQILSQLSAGQTSAAAAPYSAATASSLAQPVSPQSLSQVPAQPSAPTPQPAPLAQASQPVAPKPPTAAPQVVLKPGAIRMDGNKIFQLKADGTWEEKPFIR